MVRSDAERKKAARAADRVIRIPTLSPEDRAERLRREADDELWLRSYWRAFSPDEFYPPSPQQRQMMADFRAVLEHGGDRATAASRGEGKTLYGVALTLKEILRGNIDFAILLGATAPNANNMLETISMALAENEELARYYPEVCTPIAALEHTSQRAGKQLASGDRFDTGEPYEMAQTSFHWAGNKLIFPNVPGSPSAGAIVISQGLDSALRGLKVRNRRPRIVVIDDPDTDDTISNPVQADKLLRKIDRGIAALGSQKRPVTRLVLATIASVTSAAARLTDHTVYPSFRGRRFRFLITPPTNQDLWTEFVNLCHAGWSAKDEDEQTPPIPFAAHQHYLTHRAEMDLGGEVSNEHRYDHRQRPEGGTVEASALEHYYGWVARIGQESTSTEFDNDPSVAESAADDGLSPHRVQHQVSGYARRVVPPGCYLLTMGVDVGKFLLHWVVVAWKPDGTSFVIDHGIEKVHGTTRGSEEGIEQAIVSAIRILVSEKTDDPYTTEAGEVMPLGLTLIDEGYCAAAVRAAAFDLRPDVFPAKGEGDDKGTKFFEAKKLSADVKPGDNWRQTKELVWPSDRESKSLVRTYHHNSAAWKDWAVNRWLTPRDKPGCRFVFGEFTENDKQHVGYHADFSHQVCANCYRDETKHGRTVRCWGERPGQSGTKDHYQDALALADVAASVKGVRLEVRLDSVGQSVAKVATTKPRRTLAQMMAGAEKK